MDRKILIIGLVLMSAGAGFAGYRQLQNRVAVADIITDEAAWDRRDASPQNKVIITDDGVTARYVGEDGTSYFGEIQDEFTVPKEDATVETWYACDGKGIVSLNEEGTKPAYAAPDSLSSVVGELQFEQGYYPEAYNVTGYGDGWFSIEINGKTGYIREEYVCWDTICSF